MINEFDITDLLKESVPLFPEPISFPAEDLVQINQRLEQLTVEVNTHHIKLELETLKQAKAEIYVLNQALTQQQNDNITLREQMATLSNIIFSELDCLTQRTHCCLGRIHH